MTSRCGNYHAILYRDCVDRMAETAGCHFFKCPLCNNKQQFSEEMKQFGELLLGVVVSLVHECRE